VSTSQSCSWCHTMNFTPPFVRNWCSHCKHAADRPREECDCATCETLRRRAGLHTFPTKILERQFRRWWKHCAELGECDFIDGLEYDRVSAEWIAAGCPWPAWEFIRNAANRPASAEPRPQKTAEGDSLDCFES